MGNNTSSVSSKPKTTTIRVDKPITLPPILKSRNEFFEEWLSWKNSFLKYKNHVYTIDYDEQNWGDKLLNVMGPVGQEISRTFIFDPLEKKNNIDTLLNKFDLYYIFGAKRRKIRENILEYLYELQTITKNKGLENGDDWIRKKMLTEIDREQFLTAAKTIIPTFTYFNDFNQLTLKEIAFIWMLYCDDVMRNCKKCGSDHNEKDKCPALGVQCSRCNALNHYNRRCPQIFISNCRYCGSCHFQRKCPAYYEICTKCQKQHHFSWTCKQQHIILSCKYCGLTHAASKSACSAKNTVCSKCHVLGHVASLCHRTSRFH